MGSSQSILTASEITDAPRFSAVASNNKNEEHFASSKNGPKTQPIETNLISLTDNTVEDDEETLSVVSTTTTESDDDDDDYDSSDDEEDDELDGTFSGSHDSNSVCFTWCFVRSRIKRFDLRCRDWQTNIVFQISFFSLFFFIKKKRNRIHRRAQACLSWC